MKNNMNNMKQQINFENQAFNMNIPINYKGNNLFDFSKMKKTNKKIKLTNNRRIRYIKKSTFLSYFYILKIFL
jgi:hypothetical protein